jgi:UDP-N-acetylmuramoyl-L-alanyl-D-glutamate--2,6-diaminopimelate ligase
MAFDKKLSFSINNSSMLKAEEIIETGWWTSFKFSYLWKIYSMNTRLLWAFNVYNILSTIWVWIQIWLNVEDIIKILEWFQPWDNKFQNFEDNWIFYFIDASSSPDSLDKVLKFLAHIKNKWRLITMIWAPWWILLNKRSNIWLTAQRYSDILAVTDDDPWYEDRLNIIRQLTEKITMKEWENFFVIPERTLAIKFAVKIAQKWDIVIFVGKWKQSIQKTNFGNKSWNEKEEILNAIKSLTV